MEGKGIALELLMVGEERQERVKDEVDYLIECPFTESFRQKSAEDFIQEIIHDLFSCEIYRGRDRFYIRM